MNISLKRNTLFFLSAFVLIASLAASALTDNWIFSAIPFLMLFLILGWAKKELVFFLLLLVLPFSIEYKITVALGTDLPDEPLMLLTAFLFFAYWIYSPGLLTGSKLKHPLLFILFLSFAWMIGTSFFSTDPAISWKYILAKSWYIGAFILAPLIMFSNKKNITRSSLFLVSSMLIVALITLFRFTNYDFRFANVNDAIYPFFRNHVNYSALLVCLLPVTAAFLYLNRGKKYAWLFGFMSLVFLIALVFSYSRGAWLALVMGLFTMLLIKKRLFLVSYLAAILIILLSFFWIKSGDRYLDHAPNFNKTIFHPDFSEHWIATYKLRDVSTAERFYRWIAGARMIKDKWLTGYGPNTFYDNYKDHTVPAYKTWVSNNPDHSTVHNYFLLTATEQGIPGLVFLLLLIGAMIYYSEKIFHRVKDEYYKTAALVTAMIISMLLVLNFLSDLIETDKIGSIFFLCISLLISIDSNSSDPPANIERIPQPIPQ